jgi:hypothetical protein
MSLPAETSLSAAMSAPAEPTRAFAAAAPETAVDAVLASVLQQLELTQQERDAAAAAAARVFHGLFPLAPLPSHWEPMRPEEEGAVTYVVLPLPGDDPDC